MADGQKARVSIVVPCYNEHESLPALFSTLSDVADGISEFYVTEFILVDDGSHDSTWEQICSYAGKDSRWRGARLSRNFGQQAASTCGYALATGDAVICLDADLQDPPELIPRMLESWRQGADIVYAIRATREGETRFKLWTAMAFYRLLRYLGVREVQTDSGDFRLMSTRAVAFLLQMGEQHRFLRGMVGWLGFKTATVHYDRRPRAAGITKYSPGKMLKLALDAIFSFSGLPLRLPGYCALLLAAVFIVYIAYATARQLWLGAPAESAWLPVLLAVVAFGAANLASQALLGDYLRRIYEECKRRPLYVIQEFAGNLSEPMCKCNAVEHYMVPSRPQVLKTGQRPFQH